MRRRQATIGLQIVFVFAWLMAASGWARAEQGTLAQRLACTPDVYRLCSEFIPNADEITKCLKQKLEQLNSRCKKVFTGELK